MKYAVCIPTYNRSELLQVVVGSIINDPSNPGFPIFVSSDSGSGYRNKEIENLKKICNNCSKIYYTDTERSEPYKRQLEKLSGLSRKVIDIAMNGGSAGANRNRLLLLACTLGADAVIFSDDDMEAEDGFIEYHNMAMGGTISQFLSKLKQKGIKIEPNEKLTLTDLEKNIEVFSAGWRFYHQKRNRFYKEYEFLDKGFMLDAGNLSMTSLVYSLIPFPLISSEEDYVLGYYAQKMLEPLSGVVIRGRYAISDHGKIISTDLITDLVGCHELLDICAKITKKLVPSEKDFGKKMMSLIGKEVQNFTQSSELEETLSNMISSKSEMFFKNKNPKDVTTRWKDNLYRTGVLYQNWSELTDAAKRIDPIILEEFLLSNT